MQRPLVLVAEDDDCNFKLIKAIVSQKCELLWAKNGRELLELYGENKERAGAVLMDIRMPVMDGFEAVKALRDAGATLPVIMQTAYAFNSDRERAMANGATEVLVKPLTVGVLRNCLKSYFPQLSW